MIMVLKKKKKVDGRLKKPTKLDYDYGFEKKKSWQPTLKKTHKTWLWLWFWKRKKKLTANFEKKNTKLDYDYGFEKKIIKNVTADFEKRTLDYEVYGFEKKSVEKICAENYKGVQVSFFLGRDESSDCPCIYTSQFHPSNFHRIMSESHCWNYWNWNSLSEYDNIDKVSTEHNITSTGVLWLKRIGEEKNCSPQNIIHHTLKSSYIMQILKCATYSKLSTNDAVSVLDHSPRPWCPLPMEQKKDIYNHNTLQKNQTIENHHH